MTSSGATPDGLDTENVRARLEAIDNHEQMALFALEIIPTALFEIESLRSQFEAASREIHVYQKMLADYEKERERYEAFNAQLEAANKVVEAAQEISRGPHYEICRGRCSMCRALSSYRRSPKMEKSKNES